MKWEELSTTDFQRAVDQVQGTCLLPVGVIEPHGGHLPLGSDLFEVREIALRAAEREPAIVFPWYYFGQVINVRHIPGTVALGSELMMRLLTSVCDEISRNGLKKILLVNGHGGNNEWLAFFTRTLLEKQRDYVVYNATNWWEDLDVPEAPPIVHAGEGETSLVLALTPHLVKMDQAWDKEKGERLGRYDHLAGVTTSTSWYANYPNQYAGDGSRGTAEQGEKLLAAVVEKLAEQIRVVKNDQTAPRLQQEFFDRCRWQ